MLDDGSIWNSQSQTWSHIPKQNSIKFFLNNDDDLVEQYRLDICSKAEFPYTKEQLKKVKYLFPEEHARTYCRQYFLILAKRYPELVTDGY